MRQHQILQSYFLKVTLPTTCKIPTFKYTLLCCAPQFPSTREGPERHISCLARHYFANARKMLWSRVDFGKYSACIIYYCISTS